MKKDILIISILIIILFWILITGTARINCGDYEGSDNTTTYSCYIDKHGHVSIADIGAGNPIMSGYFLQLTKDKFLILHFSDWDESLLGNKRIIRINFENNKLIFPERNLEFKKYPRPQKITSRVNYPPLRR